jgi:hypothetical protein
MKRELDVGTNLTSLSKLKFVRKSTSLLPDQSFLSHRKLRENTSACFLKALSSSNATSLLKEKSKLTRPCLSKTLWKLLTKFLETSRLKLISKLREVKAINTPQLNRPPKWLSRVNSMVASPTLNTLKDKCGSCSSGLPGASRLKLPLPRSTIWHS